LAPSQQKKKKKKQCVTVTVRRGSCSGPLPLLPRRTHPSAVVDRDALGTRNPVERSSRALCRASPCSRLLPGPHFSPFSLSLMSRRWTKNNNNSSLIYSALFDLCIPKKFHNKKLLLLLWWWCRRSNVLELLDAQVLTRGAYLLTPTYAHTRIPLCILSISALFSSHQNPDHVFWQRSQLSSSCKLDWICLLNAHAQWWELMRAS